MGVGRLFGDPAATRFGETLVARSGAVLAAAGLGLALATSAVAVGIVGFAMMGLGLAAIFPLTLRAAARHPETAGPDLAAVSTVGYLGLLSGPPVIGVLAELTGLRAALLLVCGACLVAGALAARIGADSTSAS